MKNILGGFFKLPELKDVKTKFGYLPKGEPIKPKEYFPSPIIDPQFIPPRIYHSRLRIC